MNRYYQNFISSIKNKRVMFCGLGRSNLPIINMMLDSNIKVIACDSKDSPEIRTIAEELKIKGAEIKIGSGYLNNIDTDIIFRTPGMNFLSPELVKAKNSGIVVTSEMEVFFDLCPCKIIAITGSDGKTTTTSIISELLKSQGYTVHIGGNIGMPLLPNIENIRRDDIVVAELSSFQLISMRRSPDVAVVTNISPNHLDIHKHMQEYIDSKKNIILHQNAFGKSVLNLDNQITNSFKEYTRGDTLFFSRKQKVDNGTWVDKNGIIYFSKNGTDTPIMDSTNIRIPGNHNLENYLAAIASTWDYMNVKNIEKTAQSFSGVEHRVEFVRELDEVKYYNDSIASSPTRTISGTLSLFDEKIILIAGGYDKNISFSELGDEINKKVKVLILLGDTAVKIEQSVKNSIFFEENQPTIINVSNMEEAVSHAHKLAVKGDVVAMSPASASFGLYKNFEERGRHFKNIVNNLISGGTK